MKVQVLGSSSAGNCYIVNDELIIELGLPALEIKRGLNFELRKVVAAVVSHKHGDHAKSLKDFAGMFPIVAPAEALRDADVEDMDGALIAKEMRGVKIGGYKILPLKMIHDCECYGYIIEHNGERLGFFTDTCLINYNLPQLDLIMIEANYSREIIDRQLLEGVVPRFLHDRVMKSHLAVETALLACSGQEKLKNILLIHLSSNNAYPDEFKRMFEEKTGVETQIASKGVIVETL